MGTRVLASIPQPCSHNMQIEQEVFEKIWENKSIATKIAAYAAYILGGSVFVGVARLVAALRALSVDYSARSELERYKDTTSHDEAIDFNSVLLCNPGRMPHNIDGEKMRKSDFFSHWVQVARSIAELTVVGGWIWALFQAAQGRSDIMDMGRYHGMLTRSRSKLEERQYVCEGLYTQLTQTNPPTLSEFNASHNGSSPLRIVIENDAQLQQRIQKYLEQETDQSKLLREFSTMFNGNVFLSLDIEAWKTSIQNNTRELKEKLVVDSFLYVLNSFWRKNSTGLSGDNITQLQNALNPLGFTLNAQGIKWEYHEMEPASV